MAKLDPILARLLRDDGVEVFFQSGGHPVLRTLTQTTNLMKQPLHTVQIVSAFAELVPDHLRRQFPLEGTTRWQHATPQGRVRITFNRRDEKVSVSVRPFSAGDATEEEPVTQKLPMAVPLNEVVPMGPAMPVPTAWAEPPNLKVVPPATPPVLVQSMPTDPLEAMHLLLELMLDRGASDLHLTSQAHPMLRVDGDMTSLTSWPRLPADRLGDLLFSITPERNREEWHRRKDSDFAYETPRGRFRVNLFADRSGIGAVLRHIPNQIRTAEELGLSKAIIDLCGLSKGLVLVTGPTGSGKSTTLAAMIDHINRTRDDHIITIEDPVEFVHPHQRCLVNQREVGVHTDSFKDALRAALREDPDVILVGELRDLETISMAIETAETGHLVFGTLHTNTAPSTVDRIIDQFPSDRQAQVRTMLSESLRGVVAQTLCKKIGGGRVAAHEILLVNHAVSNVIREGKTYQLMSAMQTGRAHGMCTLNDSLLELVKKNVVDPKVALQKSVARAEFRTALERAGIKLEGEGEPAPSVAAAG